MEIIKKMLLALQAKLESYKKPLLFLSLCFIIPFFLLLLIYFIMGHYPIADESVLVLDLNAQYVYFYEALRDSVFGDTSLLYSFSRSLGGEFLGIYAYYLASPLSYIVCLFPKKLILFALLLILAIKSGLIGFSFGFFLYKHSEKKNRIAITIFSTLFALCGYSLTYQNNIMWMDGLFWLPIITYAIEKLIKEKKFILYVFSLAMMMISHYYIGYMICWYIVFAFFFIYFKDKDRNLINPIGESKHFLKSLIRIFLYSVLGIGIAAFMIYAAYYSLTFGKTEFTNPSFELTPRFYLTELFPKLLPGSYDTLMHEGYPNIYCGIITLFLIPLFFFSKRINLREKIAYFSISALYVLIMLINPLDLAMHGFQEPNCLNYRYSFILVFFMLIMAYKAFFEIPYHSKKSIIILGISLTVALLISTLYTYDFYLLEDCEYYSYGFVQGKMPFLQVFLPSIISIIAFSVLLSIYIKKNQKAMSIALLSIVCIELVANGAITRGSMDCDVGCSTYSSYVDYIDEYRQLTEKVLESDNSFYRSEKTTHRTTNDNMALGLKGLSNSTSTLNEKIIALMGELGYYSDSHWTQYYGGTVLTDSVFGIKYIFSKYSDDVNGEVDAKNELMQKYFELYMQSDSVYCFENPNALSIAFVADENIKNFNYSDAFNYKADDVYYNPFDIEQDFVNSLLGEDSTFFNAQTFNFYTDISYDNVSKSSVDGGKEWQMSRKDTNEKGYVIFNLTVQNDGPMYFYMPTNYERDFSLYLNDEFICSDNDYSRIVYLGNFSKGDEIKVSIQIKEKYVCFYQHTNYFYTLDMNAYNEAMQKLSQNMFIIDEGCKDNKLTGTITTNKEKSLVFTTIPYDSGWNVYVDGKKVEISKAYNDTFLVYEIEGSGTHTVTMNYMPKLYIVTAGISLVSLAVFISLIILSKKKKSKNTEG